VLAVIALKETHIKIIEMAEFNSYELSRNWFDWCFENPDKINSNHTALYFFIIEHCNRLGWKEKFGLPTTMTMDALGIKNYKTYAKTFDSLVEWGFIKLIEKSKNQWSATVIALVKNTKANTKALTKASITHSLKQVQSTVSIDKPINLITNNNITTIDQFFLDFENGNEIVRMAQTQKTTVEVLKSFIPEFKTKANSEYPSYGKFVDHFRNTWLLKRGSSQQSNLGSKIILGRR